MYGARLSSLPKPMRCIFASVIVSILCILTTNIALAYLPVQRVGVSVDFLEVGQGDAILLQTPTGRRVLIDTGPKSDVLLEELSRVLPPFVNALDMVFLTHSDQDHIGGTLALLDHMEVGEIVLNDEVEQREGIREILAKAQRKGITVTHARKDQDLRVEVGVYLDLLTPLETPVAPDANNHSLVLMLVLPTDRLLLMGDAEEIVEKALLKEGSPLRAAFLKGGHHGSKTSSGSNFLQAVSPKAVTFQNGVNNTYGHPSPEVLSRLAALGMTVYNTSIDGGIHLQCPPKTPCTITTEHRAQSP